MRAILVNQAGGPDVLTLAEVERPSPGPEQLLVEVAVSGLNFFDVYQRRGATALPHPFVAGIEGVGVVTEVGSAVTGFSVGQRVGWFTGGQGSFADFALVTADRAVPIPDDVDDERAAAVMLQGVTAHYLAVDTYPIQPGDTVVVHAAAGGVGQLLTQIAKVRGATVIGTTSTPEKAEIARAAGADDVVAYSELVARVHTLTSGTGVVAVYDGVGAATFQASLDALRPRGVLVSFGSASGSVPPFDIQRLNSGGSLYLTRPTAMHYTATTAELRSRTDDLFGWLAQGKLRVEIGARYPLDQTRAAFEALESRNTSGKVLLIH